MLCTNCLYFFLQQRTAAALREREKNIRKDLGKLLQYHKKNIVQTGSGLLSSSNAPSVSFDMSNELDEYCRTNMIKLAGLKPVMDSDCDAAIIANDNHDMATLEPTEEITETSRTIEMPNSDDTIDMDLVATAANEATNERIAEPNESVEEAAISGEAVKTKTGSKVSSQFFLTREQQATHRSQTPNKRKGPSIVGDAEYYKKN